MDILDYVNSDGFVCANKEELEDFYGPGNGWLHTGMAVAIGKYSAPFLKMYLACKREPWPLFYRSPQRKNADDQEAADDWWGFFVLLRCCYSGSNIAKSLLDWGNIHNWVFDVSDNQSTDIRFRFDRFISFIPILRIIAGEKLSFTDSIACIATIIWDAFHIDDADGNGKAFCRIYVFQSYGYIFPLVSNIWFVRVKKKYGSVEKSWAAALCNGHPLSESK